MDSIPHNARLELLPTEILYDIRDLLPLPEIKQLSCVSKRLRQACLPSLFRKVNIQFSKSGFDQLKNLMRSDVSQYIVIISYTVPPLLKPEILDFDYYTSKLFTPQTHRYVEEAKELYDLRYHDGDCPSYMVIYDRLRSICEEQRDIINSNRDVTVLSAAFKKLPKLEELNLCFGQAVEKGDWLEPYLALDMTMVEQSYEHHLRVVSDTVRDAKNNGVFLNTICLSELKLPYHNTWEQRYRGILSDTLRVLLDHTENLRLTRCSFLLELLSPSLLNLHQFDMCCLTDQRASLESFLEANMETIRSIEFSNVRLTSSNSTKSLELSPEMLRHMLDEVQQQPNSCREIDWLCLTPEEERWRLLVNQHNQLQV